jgi:hypothetical protein
MRSQEVITKEVFKWEYFPERDLRNINPTKKDGIITKIINSFLYFIVPELRYNINGLYKVRYFEVLNIQSGKVRLLKVGEMKG